MPIREDWEACADGRGDPDYEKRGYPQANAPVEVVAGVTGWMYAAVILPRDEASEVVEVRHCVRSTRQCDD
jgi:hypothetical protein